MNTVERGSTQGARDATLPPHNAPQSSEEMAPHSEHTRRPLKKHATKDTRHKGSRWRRWARRIGVLFVVVLSVTGAASIYRIFAGTPDVGYFRSADGRAEYVKHYDEAMKTLPAPTAQHDIDTSFGIVRAYEWSTPETESTTPVVLIPGRSSGVPMWQSNLEGFSLAHRVIAFDALGDAGMSLQSVPLDSFEDQAVWIDEVLGELAPDGVHLVGHSFGGATAAVYARLHPEHVHTLTLLEPVFTFSYPSVSMMWWATVASLPGIPQGVREHALGKIAGEKYERSDDPMTLMIESGTAHFSAELPTPSPLSADQAVALTMPVYVAIAGRDSLAGGEGGADKARELLPHATVQVWPNATHSLPMQEANPLAEFLNGFWADSE